MQQVRENPHQNLSGQSMRIEGGAIEFFHSIPDEVLVEIALNEWNALEVLCIGYTLDLQIMNENNNESISNRRNVC